MHDGPHSPNYDYLIDRVCRYLPNGGRVLDFGCGTGTMMSVAVEQAPTIEFWGADTFEDHYSNWKTQVPKKLQHRIHQIKGDKLPFDDASFDIVISNQVFEHVADAATALSEIHRVLVPGGCFMSIFPLTDTWFEPHCGIYFAHWINKPARQDSYLTFWRRLGFGYYAGNASPTQWGKRLGDTIRTACHYRTGAEITRLWQNEFGTAPQSLTLDVMQYRIENHPRHRRLSPLIPILRPLLRLAYKLRAGTALLVAKQNTNSDELARSIIKEAGN